MPVRLAPRPVFLAGREGLLADMDARLAAVPGRRDPRVAVLCGLGGAGKTSVALEYAHRHLAEVGVCWQFAAEDSAVLAAEFAVLAAQMGVREVADARDPVASVHGVLARAESGWLVVFDNAPDLIAVERFMPPAGPGRVLVTTQNQHWSPGQALDVPVLDTEVGASFLVNRTGNQDRAAARELTDWLGGLPLALEQAAAYMQATGTSLPGYLRLFRDRQGDLLARGQAYGHPADVAATLGLALSRLTDEAPAAAGLLRLLAFLAPEPIPLSLLLGSGIVAGRLGPEAAGVAALLGDQIEARDAITALRRYSLISPAGDGLVLVHRLVQTITRAQLTAETASQWKQAAAALVQLALPADSRMPAAWPSYEVLLPHARAVFDLTSEVMWQVARYLRFIGNWSAARDLFRLIANAYEESDDYGPEHPTTLNARGNLASMTGSTGDVAGAREQLVALIAVRERILGSEHPDTLTSRSNLAFWTGSAQALDVAGDPVGARDQFAVLLPIFERVHGLEHHGTLSVRRDVALWTAAAGDVAGARDQFAVLLPIMEQVLGADHPDTMITHGSMAQWTGKAADEAGDREQ